MHEGSVGIDQGASKKGEMRPVRPDQELNLKGKICPYTFIESMLALEDMKPDEIQIQRNPHCRLCGDNPTIKDLIDYPLACQA